MDAQPSTTLLSLLIDDRDAAYPLTIDPLPINEQAMLTSTDGAVQDNFGYSVAIEGDTAVVGADNRTVSGNAGQGQAYLFVLPRVSSVNSSTNGTSGL